MSIGANGVEPLPILLRGDARLEQRCVAVERHEATGEELRVAAARMHATLDAFRARALDTDLRLRGEWHEHRRVLSLGIEADPYNIGQYRK